MYLDRINLGAGIDVAISNNSKNCIVCNYWYFNLGINIQKSVCNDCNGLQLFCLNITDITVITVKSIDNFCIIHYISKSETIHLLKKIVCLFIVGIYKMHMKENNIRNRSTINIFII